MPPPAPVAPPMPSVAALSLRLTPNRLGARGALTFTLSYPGAAAGLPQPLRRLVLRFPAGLSLDVPRLRTCGAARLRARGPRGCPPQSAMGAGEALMEANLGSQPLRESVSLRAFIGPARELEPTLEVFGQGYTPLEKRVVFSGTAEPARPPYGEELVMPIPPIPTLPLEPDASLASFSLTIGAERPGRRANAVIVPARCPAGGFPFAAELAYADGTSASVLTTAPCPS